MNGIFPHPWAVKTLITGICFFTIGYKGNAKTPNDDVFLGGCLILGVLMILTGIWGW